MKATDVLRDCTRSASISECGFFRFTLARRWHDSGRLLLFCMLNPSTADAIEDDATIRRCAGFAARHGFPGFIVVNLFAYRTKSPAILARMGWQTGGKSADDHILMAVRASSAVCVAWGAIGNEGRAMDRVQEVAPLLSSTGMELQCLKITRSGFPSHPLYLPGDSRLQPYNADSIEDAMRGST
jgi:hypothetical protein